MSVALEAVSPEEEKPTDQSTKTCRVQIRGDNGAIKSTHSTKWIS